MVSEPCSRPPSTRPATSATVSAWSSSRRDAERSRASTPATSRRSSAEAAGDDRRGERPPRVRSTTAVPSTGTAAPRLCASGPSARRAFTSPARVGSRLQGDSIAPVAVDLVARVVDASRRTRMRAASIRPSALRRSSFSWKFATWRWKVSARAVSSSPPRSGRPSAASPRTRAQPVRGILEAQPTLLDPDRGQARGDRPELEALGHLEGGRRWRGRIGLEAHVRALHRQSRRPARGATGSRCECPRRCARRAPWARAAAHGEAEIRTRPAEGLEGHAVHVRRPAGGLGDRGRDAARGERRAPHARTMSHEAPRTTAATTVATTRRVIARRRPVPNTAKA